MNRIAKDKNGAVSLGSAAPIRGMALFLLLAASCVAPVDDADDADDAEDLDDQSAAVTSPNFVWRPMPGRPKEHFGAAKADFPSYYARGRYWGDAHQCLLGSAWSASDPDRIVWAQDMGSVRRSDDGGRSMVGPPNLGNPLIGGNSVAIDPSNSDVLLALMSSNAPGRLFPALDDLSGVYRSTDGGVHWTLAQAIPEVMSDPRFYQNNIAAWPLTGGDPAKRKWRLLSMFEKDGGGYGAGSFWTSTNGGVAWQRGPALPAAMSTSHIYALVQHPVQASTLYAMTSTGIWRTINDGRDWTRPWNPKIPGESRSMWIQPGAPSRMFVSVTSNDASRRGLWTTKTGGDEWTRVLDVNVKNFAVGAPDAGGKRTFYVMPLGDRDPLIRDFDDGAFLGAWVKPTVVQGSSEESYHFKWMNTANNESQPHFLPHPSDPKVAMANGICALWRSEDRGRTWRVSNTGFDGHHANRIHFNPANWRELDFAVTDVHSMHTSNAGDWFEWGTVEQDEIARLEKSLGSKMPARSGYAVTRLPDDASVKTPAARGRLILSFGHGSDNFILTQNRGQTTWNDFVGLPVERGGGGVSRRFVEYSRQNPNLVYAGRNVSTDAGASWTQTKNGLNVEAMSYQNGDVVYAVRDVSGGDEILKSTKRGADWSSFYTVKHSLKRGGPTLFWVSPHDATKTFMRNKDGDVLMVKGVPGSVTSKVLNLRGQFGVVPVDFDVKSVAFSMQDPRLIYVLLNISGNESVWRGRFDAAMENVTWTPITKNAPRLAMSSDLFVHPVTGEVFLSTGHGTWVYPPPTGAVEGRSVWLNLPKPLPNGWKD